MAEFIVGLGSGIVLTIVSVALYAATAIKGRADDREEAEAEVEALRKQLAACQQTAQAQRERADYYYNFYTGKVTA